MSKPLAPEPNTLEEALMMFPGVTVSAHRLKKTWRFRIENDAAFIYDETGWRRAWQGAFRVIWKKYKTYRLD